MNKEIFVQNVKNLCFQKGFKPTSALIESGVGRSFLSDINRGQIPSVERVQMLAAFLGVTTSQLLGEAPPGAGGVELKPGELDLLSAYRAADDRAREMVHLALEPWLRGRKKDTAM